MAGQLILQYEEQSGIGWWDVY